MTVASPAGFRTSTFQWMEPLAGDMGPTSDIAIQALAARRESVKAARDFTQSVLAGWGAACLEDDLALVVSELVTNALCHGLGAGRDDATDVAHNIQLALLRKGERVMCAVQDPGESLPEAQAGGEDEESGRGLYLVGCFSDSWGWFPLNGMGRRTGKVVWAMFEIRG